MNTPQTVRSHEYKNDYLYIVIRQTPELGPQTYLYCCGINTTRFDPICWGTGRYLFETRLLKACNRCVRMSPGSRQK